MSPLPLCGLGIYHYPKAVFLGSWWGRGGILPPTYEKYPPMCGCS